MLLENFQNIPILKQNPQVCTGQVECKGVGHLCEAMLAKVLAKPGSSGSTDTMTTFKIKKPKNT